MYVFLVYPKEGKEFSLLCERFEIDGTKFVFYNSGDQPSNEAFLSFDDVAAIVLEKPYFAEHFDPFLVYLRNKDNPIPIYANSFDIGTGPRVKFYYRQFDGDESHEINDTYVATSEVIAIFPSGGLQRVRKRSIKGFPS